MSMFWRLIRIQAAILLPMLVCAIVALVAMWQPERNMLVVASGLLATILIVAGLITSTILSRQVAIDQESVDRLVRLIAAGDYSGRLPPLDRDRLGRLASDLDQMQAHLQERFNELQSHYDRLRAVLDSMVEGVIAVDEEQRVLLLNDAVCRQFGVVEETALHRPVWEQIRNPQLQDWVTQAMSQSEPAGGELKLLSPAPRVLQVRVIGLNRSRSQPGGATGAVVVVSDLSEIRRLEAVRQEFVTNASHELKTPLASIKACVETLLDGAMDDTDARQRFLTSIKDQADRLDNLVRDMLALTRVESGELQRELHPTSLDVVAATCLERHRQAAERKQMRLFIDESPSNVLLHADEEPLEEILDNLLDNAIKYTNEGGTVALRWRLVERDCAIEVEDSGIGIPQSHQVRIFERFYRVDRARSRELGGTGLGLSIVRHLVQSLGGRVTVVSRLGKGSKFTVVLPLANS
jgi:two-component system phosphate regulon sensor histidine kinase PhoR